MPDSRTYFVMSSPQGRQNGGSEKMKNNTSIKK